MSVGGVGQNVYHGMGVTITAAVVDGEGGLLTGAPATTAGGRCDGIFRDEMTEAGDECFLQTQGVVFAKAGAAIPPRSRLMVNASRLVVPLVTGGTCIGESLNTTEVAIGKTVRVNLYLPAQTQQDVRGADTPSVAGLLTIPAGANWFRITGTNALTGITVPTGMQDGTVISVMPVAAFTWTNATNIAVGGTAVVGRLLQFKWDAVNSKWYPSYV